MQLSDIQSAVRSGLRNTGYNAYRAAVDSGLPEDAIRSVLNGHEPKATRLSEICAALDLEFYIGPPRELVPSDSQPVQHLPFSTVTRAQARMLADVAAENGCILEIKIKHDGVIYRITPEDLVRDERRPTNEKEIELNYGVFVTPVPMPEGETSTRISPHGCAWFGSGMLAALDLDPEKCKAVEIRSDAMAPELPARSVTLIDERRKELREGMVYALDTPSGIVVRRATLAGSQWLALPSCSPWEPIRWPEAGEEAILGEAIWRAKYVPVGGPPGPNGLTDEPRTPPAGEPAYKVVPVDTSDASVEPVPWRGRLEPHQPRDFETQVAAWFGTKFISGLLDDPAEAEVTVPVDDTMAPSLWPNSAVVVDRRRTTLRDGAIYEIETSDGLMFRRAIARGKEWTLGADDPEVAPRPWAGSDEVVGEAVWTGGLMPGVETALRV